MQDLINMNYEDKHITKPIRLIELFGGIGSQAAALRNIGANFEHYRLCEFDKYCIKSYNAIHGTNFEVSDITEWKGEDLGIVDKDQYEYLMTYSFPCQDISQAGNQKGFAKGDKTRSGLLWEVERLLKECLYNGGGIPQILLMENVPQVHSKKFADDFDAWLEFLSSIGYDNYYDDLNAKEYANIPQNRNRCYMISILSEGEKHFSYEFPEKIPLDKHLCDMLEDEVDEKYYLSDEMINYITSKNDKYKVSEGSVVINRDVACSKTTREGSSRADTSDYICKELPENYKPLNESKVFVPVFVKNKGKEIVRETDIAHTLLARDSKGFGNQQMTAIIEEKTSNEIPLKRGYAVEVKEEDQEASDKVDIIGNYSKSNFGQTHIVGKNGLAPTVTENHGQVTAIVEDEPIKIKTATKKGYDEADVGDGVDLLYPNSKTRRGRVQRGISQTITTNGDNIGVVIKSKNKRLISLAKKMDLSEDNQFMDCYNQSTHKEVNTIKTNIDTANMSAVYTKKRIRKLTPKECWRLMGFKDEDFEKAQKVNSNTQLYKQAGNAICVPVLERIFKKLF